jgi:Domain of unknown function (DUF1987).
MKNIEIPAVKEAPYFPIVHFDHEKGVCEISGESYMEDCYKFYIPLIEWLNEYCASNKYIIFNFRLFYFNTQSSRMLLKIFETLTEFKAKGGEPTINWYYMRSDPDMIDEIDDFQHESGLEINLIEMNE